MLMKIGEISKKSGCKVVTIRYYEQKGLLKKGLRTPANYRLYDEEDLERLNFIMHCRIHNLSLNEIKKLLMCGQNTQQSCEWIGDMIDGHITEIDKQIQSLESLKQHLQNLRLRCSGNDTVGNCAIIKQLHKHIYCKHNKNFK
uniref:Cd(II)/Pb(II)-responsive transcriptional regulator n=1 Tax=uncultured Alphaproteobacteria bacterium TaxID=91750 RepID=A0A6G8F2E6_9PROT|nr:Cd(II)/Pb(II)-responsive transcriptional regulator [uncultured Alphaproteobacteria bacterium]